MKIAIHGAGAMGTTLGALMQKAGIDVHLFARNPAHISALKSFGATVVCSAENKEICVPVSAFLIDDMTEKYDVIFLMTKQRDNVEIAQFLKDKLTESGVVVTTQNGLPERLLSSVLGKEKVLGGVCTFGANFLENGKTELTSAFLGMRLEIGGGAAAQRVVDALMPLCDVIGENFVCLAENLDGIRWNKLCINATFSTLSVVTGQTFGYVAKNGRAKRVALDILRECFSVQDALGVRAEKMQGKDLRKLFFRKGFFGRTLGLFLLPIAMKKHSRLTSGMLADIKKGKKCEVDYIAGAVLDLARQTGVETPNLALAVEIVHGIENGLYEITPKNLAFFE